ncbi:MAG: hypothetical protein H6739_06405 [Alphaproteobacteria bacterium]|nr:hypothetical protein [Alphaproteobacteria bacterium]MCB9759453.1 hypothetical protein [Alphaproteobacteria bacterium]
MSEPKHFQRATIRAALRAFDGRRRVRRFLVADEVGLGKTVVAREVLRHLVDRRRGTGQGPLKVFYVCSSLAIAGQNRDSLLKALDDEAEREGAGTDVDRLTLLPNRELDDGVPLHLLTLTPDTSLPDRAGKRRDGKAEERALIHNLLEARYPGLESWGGGHWLQREAKKSWGDWIKDRRTKPKSGLASTFFDVVRRQLGLEPGQHLPPRIRRRVERDPLDAIQQLRIALARAGLEQLRPDLVIFDEFQRFSDLLRGEDRGSDIAREMVGAPGRGPAVLLLSATPFRLFGGEFETAFDGQSHHEQFFSLVEWLFGGPGDTRATKQREALEERFRDYARGLRSSKPLGPQTRKAKADIEEALRGVMARTERFGHELGQQATRQVPVPAPLHPSDFAAYRHQVACFQGHGDEDAGGRKVGAAIQYWNSVPLAMQTLGSRYKPWKEARLLAPESDGIYLRAQDPKRFNGPKVWAHPRVRALREQVPPEQLAVPWVAPSLPWWETAGAWKTVAPAKVLLFSRFRATPRAVAALLSYDVERLLLRGGKTTYAKVTEKVMLGPSRENLAFFHPSPALITLLDPATLGARSRRGLVSEAKRCVRDALAEHGVVVRRRKGAPRPLPELVVALERRLGMWTTSQSAWTTLARDLSLKDTAGDKSLERVVEEWGQATTEPLDSISAAELDTLVETSLSGAGVVLGRSLARHGLVADWDGLSSALRTSWSGLRSYLNNPWMESSLQRLGTTRSRGAEDADGRGYRSSIQAAILEGNLESVLDEHLWITRTLRGSSPSEAAKALEDALSLRTSSFVFHGLGGQQDLRLRAHAALPFTAEVQQHRAGKADTGRSASARQDELRGAFNSPFWPHVLASTSVGQEGLDFHAWCARVAHWDLPGNPVDLEQREGRVDRYGGLAVRRALASKLKRRRLAPFESPWQDVANRADDRFAEDEAGLAPWWICRDAAVERLVFDVPLSEANERLEQLKQQRMLYRLTLGQPDQEDLVAALQGRVTQEEARAATLVLSPWRYE